MRFFTNKPEKDDDFSNNENENSSNEELTQKEQDFTKEDQELLDDLLFEYCADKLEED